MKDEAVCWVFDFELPALRRATMSMEDAYGVAKNYLDSFRASSARGAVDAKRNPTRTKGNTLRARTRKRTSSTSGDDS